MSGFSVTANRIYLDGELAAIIHADVLPTVEEVMIDLLNNCSDKEATHITCPHCGHSTVEGI